MQNTAQGNIFNANLSPLRKKFSSQRTLLRFFLGGELAI